MQTYVTRLLLLLNIVLLFSLTSTSLLSAKTLLASRARSKVTSKIKTALRMKGGNKWCQTEEVKGDPVPEDFGGSTWGQVDESNGLIAEYIIKVFSATSSQGQTTGGMAVTLLGDCDISDPISVSEPGKGFGRGSITVVNKQMPVVGNIVKVKVTMTNEESEPYLCESMTISVAYLIFHVPCSNTISKEKMESFTVSGNIEYSISLEITKACKDPVFITIQGNAGTTIRQVLSDHGFGAGPFTKTILGDPVGDIFKVKIEKLPGQAFEVTKLQVLSGEQKVEWSQTQTVSSAYTWIKPKPKPDEPPKKKKVGTAAPPKEPTKMEKLMADFAMNIDHAKAGKFFNGSCLNNTLMEQAIQNKLTCEDTFNMKMEEFDIQTEGTPEMMHLSQIRYMSCPKECFKEGLETIGAIIHPTDAIICASAWADRSITHAGGIIQVVLTNAQISYKHHFWKTLNGVTLASGGANSKVGFVTAKVDNPDFVSKKIRLVNGDKLDSEGRLEIMIDREWTTVKPIVCPKVNESQSQMMDKLAASACKQLGYKFGIVKGTESNKLGSQVPQRMIQCHSISDGFPCEICEPLVEPDAPPPVEIPDHTQDVTITCIKNDPTNKSAGKGLASIFIPQEGLEEAYPALELDDGQKALLCDSAFKVDGDKLAKLFCKTRAYPILDPNWKSIDNSFDFKKVGSKIKQATAVSGLDFDKLKAKNISQSDDPNEHCPPVKIKCGGMPDGGGVKADPKILMRLPGPTIETLTCSDSPASLGDKIKGDPGSVFTFICPENCDKGGTLIGAGLQAWSSPICMAAIHQQLIPPTQTSFVSIVTGIPKVEFIGRTNSDGIQSSKYPDTDEQSMESIPTILTYAVIDTNTCQLFGFEPPSFLQNKAQAKVHSHTSIGVSSRSIHSSMHEHQSMESVARKTQKERGLKKLQLSFMQMRSAIGKFYNQWFQGVEPFFVQGPREAEVVELNMGKEDQSIDMTGVEGEKLTAELGEGFTIIVGVNLETLPKKDYITIFSHSSNNCWEFVVADLTKTDVPPVYQFRKKGAAGTSNIFNTKHTPRVGVPEHIVLSQQKGKMSWFINGKKGAIESDGLEFSEFDATVCPGNLMLGSDLAGNQINGKIYYWAVFTDVWGIEKAMHFHDQVTTTILLPKGQCGGGGSVTTDLRACVSPVNSLPVPPAPGAPAKPEPKVEVEAGALEMAADAAKAEKAGSAGEAAAAGSESGSSDAGVEQIAEQLASDNPEMEAKLMKEAGQQAPTDEAGCIMSALQFQEDLEGLPFTEAGNFAETGKKVVCPEDCLKLAGDKMLLFGPESGNNEKCKFKFSATSSVCAAAIQAGVIDNLEGGNVLIHLAKRDSPNSVMAAGPPQNGLTPKIGNPEEDIFYMSPSPPPIPAKCLDSASDLPIDKADGRVTVVECPKNCYKEYKSSGAEEAIFGGSVTGYTWDSSVCLAAMHQGLLSNAHKAVISVKAMIEKNGSGDITEKEYSCKLSETLDECEDVRGLGIKSNIKKFAEGGFMFADPVQACKYYKDNTKVPILQRQPPVKGGEDQRWNGKLFGPKNKDLEETRNVNDAFECANCKIEMAFSLSEKSVKLGATEEEYFGIVFRWSKIDGVEGQYMVKLNRKGVEIEKVQDGGRNTLVFIEQAFDVVQSIATQDIMIKYVGPTISVDLMKDPEQQQKNLITLDEPSIHRGSVGFEKKGDIAINIIQFQVSDPRQSAKKEHIDVLPVVRLINQDAMESDCALFKSEAINDLRRHGYCMSDVGYCERGCKPLKFYRSKFYNCLFECTKNQDIQMKVKANSGGEQSFPCKEVVPGITFSSGLKIDQVSITKCDGSNNDEGIALPAWVTEANTQGEICEFTVKYICDQGKAPKIMETIESDKSRFITCGEGIKARKDKCESKVVETKDFIKFNKFKNLV